MVREKIILGVLVDFDSSFTLLLNWALKRGWETFVPFFHAAESGGFSLRMLAAQVETCIVTKITHLVPFLCVAPRAYHKLNRLQWRWGKIFLGIRDHVEVRQTLVRTHCGWQLSLGAKVASEVLVICYSFRYPCFAHPLQVMCIILAGTSTLTREMQTKNWFANLGLPRVNTRTWTFHTPS